MNLKDWAFMLLEICLFRKGPENLPYSRRALSLLLLILALIFGKLLYDFLAISKVPEAHCVVIKVLLAYLSIRIGFVYRFVQLLSASLGVELVFLGLTLVLSIPAIGLGIGLEYIGFILGQIWKPLVYASMFKSGFSVSSGKAALLAIALLLLEGLLTLYLLRR